VKLCCDLTLYIDPVAKMGSGADSEGNAYYLTGERALQIKQGEALALNRKEWDLSECSRCPGKSEDTRFLGMSIQKPPSHVPGFHAFLTRALILA